MTEEEQKTVVQGRNWADEDDDAAEDDDVEIGGATMAQVGQVGHAKATKVSEAEAAAAFDDQTAP